MPFEINEIGIRVRVRDEAETDEPGEKTTVRAGGQGCNDPDREEIVEDCVRRVLQILRNLGER